jgi:galactonate dehydratase
MSRTDRRTLLKTGLASLAGFAGLPSLSAAVQNASTPLNRPKLKITDVRTAEVRVHGYQVHVRVYTDQGLIGQGESTDAAAGNVPLIQSFGRMLIGQDPLNVEAAFERIRTSGVFAGAQSGQYVTALTGIEIALWDLAGKALGVPVYQLLGGKVRNRVRVYCDSGAREMIPGDERSKARIEEIKQMGFTAAKIDIDDAADPARFDRVNWTASNGEIAHMVEKVAFTRERYGKTFDLAVDMHARYDATTGKRVAKELEPLKLMWLEEPVPAENIDAMRDVRESTSTPIQCGENVYLRWGFRELLEKRAVDIIAPDLQKCGGLLEGRKIADLAHTYYVPVAPHAVTSPIGMMATAHVAAVIPNFLCQEWHWIDDGPLWRNWVKEGEIIEKGFITPSERPGIGVEMNEETARKAQVPGTPWFEATPGIGGRGGRGRGGF